VSPIQASLQKVFIECLQSMLAPIVRLTLHCGLGYSEFAAASRRVFVDVASKEYGVRGRPANVARISAKTGLPRKVVRTYRTHPAGTAWSPDDEVNPINTVIHYWRFDERFCSSAGMPRDLSYEGELGFVALVKSYAGDIPASTIRQELLREGIAAYTEGGLLTLLRDYSFPESLDEDFLRNAAFSIRHHAETLFHNALLVDSGNVSESEHREFGKFERIAWSRRLSRTEERRFQLWVRDEGSRFIQRADEFISRHEDLSENGSPARVTISGVGIFFFAGN
jgi:hypothetical protein